MFRLPVSRAALPLSRFSRSRPVAMPLKSKIQNPAINPPAMMSTNAEIPREQPGDEPDDVLFNILYGARTIELNRPKKLNSLNGSMARKIIPRLLEWEKSQMANVIIISGAGERAFCAGGDVAELARYNTEGPNGQEKSKSYFGLEYQLDHLIATYPKPYVALMDGITMGGGVGLSVHAPFRIATERTVFAMPETTIGFFPDVGGSFFLPRLDGEIGTYLALTSERLKGVNAFYAGIATHYIDSSSLPSLTTRLAELVFKDYMPLKERQTIIDSTIQEFTTGLPHDEPILLAGNLRKAIDRCFRHHNIGAILSALESEAASAQNPHNIRDWASRTLQTLRERSPTSVAVALRQMRLGHNWSIAETFQREYHIAAKFMEHPDFVEGVSARLIRKPAATPRWNPPTLEQVDDAVTERFFVVEGQAKLPLLRQGKDADYSDYPHAAIGLPRERLVEAFVREGGKTKADVLRHFVSNAGARMGAKEKVLEILSRATEPRADGAKELVWKGAE